MNLAPAMVDILSEYKVLMSLLSDKLVWSIFQTAAQKNHTGHMGTCCAIPPHTV